jgi:TonB family protein
LNHGKFPLKIAKTLSPGTIVVVTGLLSGGPAAPQDAPPTPAVETPARVDPAHPIRLGESYPRESLRYGEAGLSVVRIEVDTDGVVRATQIVIGSGHARLDEAAADSFVGARMIPATLNGSPVTTWVNLPVAWNLAGHKTYRPHKVNDDEITLPIIQKTYRLKIGPSDYPSESRSSHIHGNCTVHALVGKDGVATAVKLSRSTDNRGLDQACVLAIQQAPFIPAHQGGEAINGDVDITMSWAIAQ